MGVFSQKPEVNLDMVRRLVGLVRTVAAKFTGFAGSPSTAADTTCSRLAGLDKAPQIVQGLVVRSGIGSYDCEVLLDGGSGHVVACSALTPVLGATFGAYQACLPVPGARVLVFVPPAGLSQQQPLHGIILGVVPDEPAEAASVKVSDTEYAEGGVSQLTEQGHAAVASDTEYAQHGEYQNSRAHDIVPGEWAMLNHAGAGFVLGAVSTTVKGSEAASVRCSALDDQVRIVSGHYRHINAAGGEEIFNDGGFVSVESFVSMYRSERLGVKQAGAPAFQWTPVGPEASGELRSGVVPLKAAQTARKRLYRYAGYLGDIVNVFVANPDPSRDVEDMADPGQDQGLLHYHVDSSGRFTMRSAAGIVLERYDRIPVPKRTHYAWDPAGDKADGQPAEKKPFVVDGDHPMAIGLTLADAAAWWDHQAYARFLQFDGDFSVPKQGELKCPADEYDPTGKASERFSEYDTRHSYVALTPNGGIVLRDAWGSEIVMADGRITFNAAANIEIRSGSSVIVLGGDDVVAKAYNSVDVSATKKDVRIKAEGNLQAVSMKRGVLIQSKADADVDPSSWDASGEDLVSAGVVIKADKSTVAVVGRQAEVQGARGVNVAAFDGAEPRGAVVVAGQQVIAAASDSVVATAKGTSGLVVSEQSAVVCAPSVLAVGAQSVAQVSGNNLMLGIPVEAGDVYSSVVSICKDRAQRYLGDIQWLNPVPPTVVSRVDFRFRTTEQYGTDSGSGLAGGVFSVYEPSWAMLAEAKRPLLQTCAVQAWDEGKDAVGGYPWPGAGAMDTGYCQYVEKNVAPDGTEAVVTDKAALTNAPFSSYHIRKRN